MQQFNESRLLSSNHRSEARLVEDLRRIGLRVSSADLDEAEDILGGVRVFDLLKEGRAEDLLYAWDSLMNNREVAPTSLPLLIALVTICRGFLYDSPDLNRALRTRKWNLRGTISEAAARLFTTEFNIGRRLLPDRSERNTGRALLEEGISTANYVDLNLRSRNSLIKFYGMRGVAYLLLARGEASQSPRALLEASSKDLRESRRLGDNSVQHMEYEIEALLRQNLVSYSPSLLQEADDLLKQTGITSRRLAYCAGDINLSRGVQAMKNEQFEEAYTYYELAATAFNDGLAFGRRGFDIDDRDLRAKRGYAHLRGLYAKYELKGERSLDEVSHIISDLELGEAHAVTGLTPLPEALLMRARYYRDLGDLDSAIHDIERAIPYSRSIDVNAAAIDVYTRLQGELAECRLEQSLNIGDSEGIVYAATNLISVDSFDPSIPLLSNAVRQAFREGGDQDFDNFIRHVAERLISIYHLKNHVGSTRAFAATYIAGIFFRLGDRITEEELRLVCALYTDAIEDACGNSAPETLALAGDAKYKLARVLLSSGRANDECRSLLEDSAELVRASIDLADNASESYSKQVAESKLGETYLRLYSLTDQVEHVQESLLHFELARGMGNTTPELTGRLGDCYFYLGRTAKDVSMLRRAAELKEEALAASTLRKSTMSSRENLSLTARIESSIWALDPTKASLAKAIEAVEGAHAADPAWPWPAFQLAQMYTEHHDGFTEAIRLRPPIDSNAGTLQSALYAQNIHALETLGAELAVKDREFKTRVLGGKSQAYVLDDPHGLLSATLVLKRTTTLSANQEAENARAFTTYLEQSSAAEFSVPRPVAVIHDAGDYSYYLMSHVKGRELGSLVMSAMQEGRQPPLHLYGKVVDLLALYHAWGYSLLPTRTTSYSKKLRKMANSMARSWQSIGTNEHEIHELERHLLALCPNQSLNVLKKDAHPENWLVTPRGEIVLIDLEASSHLPILYDLAHLIEDYPALSVNELGMAQRSNLIEQYLDQFTERTGLANQFASFYEDPWKTYVGFTLYVAANGLARLSRHSQRFGRNTTSFALKAHALRCSHYLDLINWLALEGPSSESRSCAEYLKYLWY